LSLNRLGSFSDPELGSCSFPEGASRACKGTRKKMAREIQEAARPASPLESKAARDQNRERLLTPRDAADVLRLSPSWLAKARMRGDGPPYVKIGRSIRYGEAALAQWMKSHQRLSTSER
jgi:predicted DNA-binding transcriptional regulator AlpA